ncbi:MAG: glycosyltransferase [Bacteroidetes bacterium]|nr:glycosyltransferase [Bacteroidota bacterium]
MSQKTYRILATFDYNAPTGFATVSKNLVKNWKKIFGNSLKLDIVAVNYFGDDYTEGENIRVISAKKKDVAQDNWGRYVFMRSLKDIDYDLIFMLADLGTVVPMLPYLKQIKEEKKAANRKQFKSILYFPVDFALTPNLGVGLEFFDSLATYTEFGRLHALRVNPAINGKIRVVPHGNNMENFYPLPTEEAQAFRKEYFGENADKFIVGSVNRNQSRKDIPTTIFGFLEYWENHNSNSLLYLHMNPKDPMGWHLRTILAQTPLRERKDFMFPSKDDYNKGADLVKLNKIYNSFDCFLSTATGGGWELTVTEAMSAKKPVIIPKHTSLEHLGGEKGERAYFLETLYPIVAQVDNIIRFQADLYEISDTLDQVFKDKKSKALDQTLKIEKAYKFVESLNWTDISKTFADEIKRLG